MRVGILEDDPVQLKLLCHVVEWLGHSAHQYVTAAAIQRDLAYQSFDMLLLDWQLPDSSGIEVLRWVREKVEDRVPVLFVTARTDENDIVEALTAGADDYIVKPVRVRELSARIRAMQRRAYPEVEGPQTYGPYCLDSVRKVATLHKEEIALTHREFDLAWFLFRNMGRLISRRHLQEGVWRSDADTNSRSVDTHISRLRRKLNLTAETGYRLTSIYSQGYRLEDLTVAAADELALPQPSMTQ
jgi:DNA-binding response OmpR family regulator